MKKIIILVFLVGCLTGCKDSSHLSNTCIKEQVTGSLKDTTTYVIGFKKDIVDTLEIIYDYQDQDINTISALRLSNETQNNFLPIDYQVLINEATHYKVTYKLDNNSEEEVKNYFNYQEKRSKFVNDLKAKGFTCK